MQEILDSVALTPAEPHAGNGIALKWVFTYCLIK